MRLKIASMKMPSFHYIITRAFTFRGSSLTTDLYTIGHLAKAPDDPIQCIISGAELLGYLMGTRSGRITVSLRSFKLRYFRASSRYEISPASRLKQNQQRCRSFRRRFVVSARRLPPHISPKVE